MGPMLANAVLGEITQIIEELARGRRIAEVRPRDNLLARGIVQLRRAERAHDLARCECGGHRCRFATTISIFGATLTEVGRCPCDCSHSSL